LFGDERESEVARKIQVKWGSVFLIQNKSEWCCDHPKSPSASDELEEKFVGGGRSA
jgi:hypothetical protein